MVHLATVEPLTRQAPNLRYPQRTNSELPPDFEAKLRSMEKRLAQTNRRRKTGCASSRPVADLPSNRWSGITLYKSLSSPKFNPTCVFGRVIRFPTVFSSDSDGQFKPSAILVQCVRPMKQYD